MPIDVLLGKAPRMTRDVRSVEPPRRPFDAEHIDLREAVYRVLRFPAVADKTFLITIGDRTVGRPHQPRPTRGPVAGSCQRRRCHDRRSPRACRRGYGHGRAHAGGSHRRSGLRAAGCRRGDYQHSGGGHRRRSRRSGCRQTGWPLVASRERTRRSTRPFALSARNCAPRSASRFRWARTRCP